MRMKKHVMSRRQKRADKIRHSGDGLEEFADLSWDALVFLFFEA